MTIRDLERLSDLLGKFSEDFALDGKTRDAIALVRHAAQEQLDAKDW